MLCFGHCGVNVEVNPARVVGPDMPAIVHLGLLLG